MSTAVTESKQTTPTRDDSAALPSETLSNDDAIEGSVVKGKITATEKDLATNSDGRLAATKFFPQFNFRSPVHYRIRGMTDDTAFLAGSTLEKGTEWREYDSATFRRVVLRPASTIGVENFKTYFSTPALARSIYNSVLMASISTVVTVSIAFALAYALTRSCMSG